MHVFAVQSLHCPMAITNFHGRVSGSSLLIHQTIMLFYITFLLLPVIIITLDGQICNAQATICNRNFNYTKGSMFESNLNTVFNRLVQNTSQSGFNTSVYGQIPNQIYGLLNCRGDTTAEQCYNCSQRAIAAIQRSEGCGNGVGGTIWMDVCFLRYENYTFSGKLSSYGLYLFAGSSTVSDPEVFNTALRNLISNLSAEAISKSNLYASGSTADYLARKIYGLVQCWRDISSDDCATCLSTTANSSFANYPERTEFRGLMANCIVQYEIIPFFISTAPPPSPSPAGASAITPEPDTRWNQNTPSDKSLKKKPIILGVAGGLLLLLLLCLFANGRRLKSAIIRRLPQDNGHVEEDALNEDPQIAFTMETLVAATGNFREDNKLGQGGFGTVYKGTTPDGKEIAVKKLFLKSLQVKEEFMNEVRLVAKIQHRNLVILLGCCAEGSERLLVYEYLPNNSLDKILFDPNKRNRLDWQKRYNIITGVARGLLYLHEDSQVRIVHRDIKASNILLDEKLNPKIADFGLAKLFPGDVTRVSTRVAGTYGYMAPEYALRGQLSVKVDVYSFGVLLLEVISGRKNTDYNFPSETQMLLGWAWKSYKRGNFVEMIDPAITETWDEEQALRCIQVGLLCTQADPSLRPQMSTVTLMLSSDSVTLPIPTEPAFVGFFGSQSHTTPGSSDAPMVAPPSKADASITVLVPR